MTITSLANRSYQLHTINQPDIAESNVASSANIQQASSLAAASATIEGFAQPIAGSGLEHEQRGHKRIIATNGDQENIGHRGEQHKWQPVANRIASILQLIALLVCFLVFVCPLLSSYD